MAKQLTDTYATRDGREFKIRRPHETDASNIMAYSKVVFASTDQVLTTLEEYVVTLEAEKIWINTLNQNPDALVLVAELNNQITGLLFFIPNTKKKNSHTGEFGVNVHPDFRGMGIGRLLVETLLNWATENEHIEKVYLNVFDTNQNAIKLYHDLGFTVEGRHIKAIKQKTGDYADVIQMYIETNNTNVTRNGRL